MRQVAGSAYSYETVGQAACRAGAVRCGMTEPAPPVAGRPHPPKKEAKKFRHPSARIVQASAIRRSRSRSGFGRAPGPGAWGAGVWGDEA